MSSGFQRSDFYSSPGLDGGGGSAFSDSVRVPCRPHIGVGGIVADPSFSSASSSFLSQQPAFLKRSLSEMERAQQQNLLLLRSVRQRTYHSSPLSPPSPIDFSSLSPEISTASSSSSSSAASRLCFPFQQRQPYNLNSNFISFSSTPTRFTEPNSEKMRNRLQELERQLLDDDDDGNESSVSAITGSEWNETMQNLITPKSPSPSSSSSSSSSSPPSSSSSSSSKQLLFDSAAAISEGKTEAATAILSRLKQQGSSNCRSGDPEQRLTAYMAVGLMGRLEPCSSSSPIAELGSAEHLFATQKLYDASPCFKLGFLAANFAILDATRDQSKIHIVEFDMGHGGQYIALLHFLSKRVPTKPTVKITAFSDPSPMNGADDPLRAVGDGLKKLAERLGIALRFNVATCRSASELSRDSFGCEPDESLVVNFAFRLYRMPDESVSTANPRDELLRVVKKLGPTVVTLLEQDLNTNTAPFLARFESAWAHYKALFDSLDATEARDSPNRVWVEECLARKAANAVAREGRDRVERSEVFGKWRARMGMAGFELRPVGPHAVDSMRGQLGPSRTHPSFFVREECGGIGVGWMDKILTVASSWR